MLGVGSFSGVVGLLSSMSTIEIIRIPVGQQATNCYLVWERESRAAVVIDPGDDATTITEKISEQNVTATGIYLTHGHFDHAMGLLELRLATGAPFFMHPADAFLLQRAENTAHHFGHESDPVPTDFSALEQIDLPHTEWSILHTPGHTPGSTCFFMEAQATVFVDGGELDTRRVVFTGDTLLPEEKTDTSHRYSSTASLRTSFTLLKELPQETMVLPGHGEPLPLVVYQPLLK